MIVIKIFVPSYFEKFRCIGGECPDTCCAGWEIDLDRESGERFRIMFGDMGKKVRRYLKTDVDGDYYFQLKDNRCPFLNKDNLCEMILSCGESCISKTCAMFPRFYDDFGTFREMGLGFGCPEAAKIILKNKSFVLIPYGENDEDGGEIDDGFLDMLISRRKKMFDILDGDGSFKERLSEVLKLCEDFQNYLDDTESQNYGVDFDTCIKVLSDMEYIDENRKNTLLSLTDEGFDRKVFDEYSDDFTVLMKYYIYRYFLKAIYDYDMLSKVKCGAFACAVIGRLYASGADRIKAMCGFSKEVEYSDVNLQILVDSMYDKFGVDDLIALF